MLYDYYPHPPDCKDLQSLWRPVSFLFVYSAYYVLCLGYVIAIIIAFVECGHAKYVKRKIMRLEKQITVKMNQFLHLIYYILLAFRGKSKQGFLLRSSDGKNAILPQ